MVLESLIELIRIPEHIIKANIRRANMRVLLVNPPNIEEAELEAETIPLGLLFLREFINKNGYQIELINLFYEKDWHSVSLKLGNFDFDVIGIPCYTRQRFSVFRLTDICKQKSNNIIVVLGGPHATFLDYQILNNVKSVDYIIRNEGEFAFLKLLDTIKKREYDNLPFIKGLTYRNHNEICRNLSDNQICNIDALPPPKYSTEELDEFPRCESLSFHFKNLPDHSSIAPIIASRGCNNNCLFCCNGAFWQNQIYYKPDYVISQIKDLYDNHHISLFDFYDDDLPHSNDHLISLCNKIIKSNMHIFWWCSSRAQKLEKDTLLKMKAAGCFMVSYGVESGSQKILNNINKNLKVEESVHTLELTKNLGLKTRITVSIGHPGEDDNSIRETINFIKLIKPDQIGLFLLKIYPGTPLYRIAKSNNFIDDDYWLHYDRLAVPFYTAEIDMHSLLRYRDMILNSVSQNILDKYENEVYSVELNLLW